MKIKFTLKRSCDDELGSTDVLAAKRHNHSNSPASNPDGACGRWNKAVRNKSLDLSWAIPFNRLFA
jgi:hypothetical protein